MPSLESRDLVYASREAELELDLDALIETIENEVELAACGPIVGLAVVRHGEVIVVRGFCRTYHACQIASQAALDWLEGAARLIDRLAVH